MGKLLTEQEISAGLSTSTASSTRLASRKFCLSTVGWTSTTPNITSNPGATAVLVEGASYTFQVSASDDGQSYVPFSSLGIIFRWLNPSNYAVVRSVYSILINNPNSSGYFNHAVYKSITISNTTLLKADIEANYVFSILPTGQPRTYNYDIVPQEQRLYTCNTYQDIFDYMSDVHVGTEYDNGKIHLNVTWW